LLHLQKKPCQRGFFFAGGTHGEQAQGHPKPNNEKAGSIAPARHHQPGRLIVLINV